MKPPIINQAVLVYLYTRSNGRVRTRKTYVKL